MGLLYDSLFGQQKASDLISPIAKTQPVPNPTTVVQPSQKPTLDWNKAVSSGGLSIDSQPSQPPLPKPDNSFIGKVTSGIKNNIVNPIVSTAKDFYTGFTEPYDQPPDINKMGSFGYGAGKFIAGGAPGLSTVATGAKGLAGLGTKILDTASQIGKMNPFYKYQQQAAQDMGKSVEQTYLKKGYTPEEAKKMGEQVLPVFGITFGGFGQTPSNKSYRADIHPEDIQVMKDFNNAIETSSGKGELGQIGQDAQAVVDRYFGKKYSTMGNQTIKKMFDYILAKVDNSLSGGQPGGLEVKPKGVQIPVGFSSQNTEGLAQQALNAESKLGKTQGIQPISSIPPGSNPPPTDPVQKIVAALKGAEPARAGQEALYTKTRAARFTAAQEASQGLPGEQAFQTEKSQLAGEMPKVQFESIKNQVSQDDINALYSQVKNSNKLTYTETLAARNGLSKLLGAEGTALPTENELQLLNQVFPPELTQTILDKRPIMQRLLSGAEAVLNVPRAVMASFDLSAPFRQGLFLISHPKEFVSALGNEVKYFLSEDTYRTMQQDIQSRPTYQLMRDTKLALTDMNAPALGQREEVFASNLLDKVPGFRGSNRAYSGFLTKLRADVFDSLIKDAQSQGLDVNGSLGKEIADFVNTASGRGSLGRFQQSSKLLSSTLFSPRLLASRLNLLNPMTYVNASPFVRKEYLKSLLTVAGTGMTVLSLSKLAGADVGTDPTSADFGKIKAGDTRYDIWGGLQQPIKLVAQLVSGKLTSTTTGQQYTLGEGYKPLTKADILQRFFESKSSPIVSFALGLLRGQDNTGQPFNVPKEVADRFIPIIVQDIHDLYLEGGLAAVPKAAPSIVGIGTQTYGKQIPTIGKTATGKPNIKMKQPPTVSEDIYNKITGTKITTIPQSQWKGITNNKMADVINRDKTAQKNKIMGDNNLTPAEKRRQLQNLMQSQKVRLKQYLKP